MECFGVSFLTLCSTEERKSCRFKNDKSVSKWLQNLDLSDCLTRVGIIKLLRVHCICLPIHYLLKLLTCIKHSSIFLSFTTAELCATVIS